jgi:hypothetical protein
MVSFYSDWSRDGVGRDLKKKKKKKVDYRKPEKRYVVEGPKNDWARFFTCCGVLVPLQREETIK